MTGQFNDRQKDSLLVVLKAADGSERQVLSGEIVGGDYRLTGLIGRGGMGYVFSAEHVGIGQRYALKMLAPDQVTESNWQRFQAEGRAIARLDHKNIVKIYNMGVDGTGGRQCPYYVMDLLVGLSLADCIAAGTELSGGEILDTFIQLSEGFGYAHSRGIVHRDIKPANIVLVEGGKNYPVPKIVDFGIAKLTAHHGVQSQTATGEVFGSPYYMSPEQCMGQAIDARSDIYSLGCTLFEAITGEPPFKGETALQTVLAHQNKQPPTLATVCGELVSSELEVIVAKMLAKNPADRYQTMEQLGHDLKRVSMSKAVGRSAQTGFKSSVESELANLDERYGQEKAPKWRGPVLIGLAAALVLTVVVVSLPTIFMAAKPLPKPVSSGHMGAGPFLPKQEKASVLDRESDEQKKVFAKVTEIKSEDDCTKGVRRFYCPPLAVGNFYIFQGQKNIAGYSLDERDDTRVEAKNQVEVPLNQPVVIDLVQGATRAIWQDPSILTRFAPTAVNGLRLTTINGSDIFLDANTLDSQDSEIVGLIKATYGWKNFTTMFFEHVHAPDQALRALDGHKDTIEDLRLVETTVHAEVLAKCKFLRHLKHLETVTTINMNQVLRALKGSPELVALDLRGCPVDEEGLSALADCPKFILLRLQQNDLSDKSLAAIAKIKSLRRVVLTNTKVTPEQIPSLARLARLERVRLTLNGWTTAEKARLFKVCPNVNLDARLNWLKTHPGASIEAGESFAGEAPLHTREPINLY